MFYSIKQCFQEIKKKSDKRLLSSMNHIAVIVTVVEVHMALIIIAKFFLCFTKLMTHWRYLCHTNYRGIFFLLIPSPHACRSATAFFKTIIDYTLLDVLKEEPIRVTIKGLRRTFYPPIHHAPTDNSPPEKKMQLEWVYPLFAWLETVARL